MSNIGPMLPPHLRKNNSPSDDEEKASDKEDDSKDVEQDYGPALPPGFSKPSERKPILGPSLPAHLLRSGETTHSSDDDPHLVEGEESEDEIIGPCFPDPKNDISEEERVAKEFEERSKSMKNKLLGKGDDKKLERENWMLELPPELSKNFGLGPRTFRAKAAEIGDRSGWTDTPADIEKKKQERKEKAQSGEKRKTSAASKPPTEEELLMHKRVEEYNKATRPQTLMEMHQEKRKKTDDPDVRRPFDRERDLNINRTSSKDKAKFIEQAKGLNTKFSTGTYNDKFL